MYLAAGLVTLSVHGQGAHLSAAAQRDYERYTAIVERRITRQHAGPRTDLSTLAPDNGNGIKAVSQLRSGAVEIDRVNGGTWAVDGGLLHHWRGATFVPGAKAQDMLDLLRDYDALSRYYAPEIERSRLVSEQDRKAIVAVRLKKQKIVSVVLEAEYQVEAGLSADGRGHSTSRSVHIWQVDNPGTSQERRRPEGDDDGYLWRLNSYWSFVQAPDGLFIECEAISLTRDVPAGLGWLVTPVIEELPRASLSFTLNATKNALRAKANKEQHE